MSQLSPTMSQLLTTVGAACITAMATLVGAYLAFTKDRKDGRALIIRDLEIAEKLPDGSKTKELLTTYAETRAALLPLENYVRRLIRIGLLGLALNTVVVVSVQLVSSPHSRISRVLVLGGLGCLLAAILIVFCCWAFVIDRPRKKLIDQYLSENHLPKDMLPSQDWYLKNIRPGLLTRRRWLGG